MSIAGTIRNYLDDHGVSYELVVHQPAGSSPETAQAAHVPGADLAKAVVLEKGDQAVLLAVPATRQVHLGELRRELGDTLALATEERVEQLFPDCDRGSVPPFGQAYGLDVLVDQDLLDHERIYAESGDRAALLALDGSAFRELMRHARAGRYGHPA